MSFHRAKDRLRTLGSENEELRRANDDLRTRFIALEQQARTFTCCFNSVCGVVCVGQRMCMRSKASVSLRLFHSSPAAPSSRVRRSRRLRSTLAAAPGLLAHALVTNH